MASTTSLTTTTSTTTSAPVKDFFPPSITIPSDIPQRSLFVYPEGAIAPSYYYTATQRLGEGSFSHVWKALTPREKIHEVALKISKVTKLCWEKSAKEVELLEILKGAPNVVPYLGSFVLSELHTKNLPVNCRAIVMDILSTPDTYKMFLEPCAFGEPTRLTCSTVLHIGMEGLKTLRYLEEKQVVHLDLKPENMTFNLKTCKLSIFDFGCGAKVDEIEIDKRPGTLSYNSPEQMVRMPYGVSTDWWGFGATLFELYVGYPLIAIGMAADRYLVNDCLEVMTLNFGPFPKTLQEASTLYFKNRPALARTPSDETKKILRYCRSIGKRYPGKPIWEARIFTAAKSKGETPGDAMRLIAFLEPMLRYEGRDLPLSPEEALRQYVEKIEQRARLLWESI